MPLTPNTNIFNLLKASLSYVDLWHQYEKDFGMQISKKLYVNVWLTYP